MKLSESVSIFNPYTDQEQKLSMRDFNSLVTQTNGVALNWIIVVDELKKHLAGQHDQLSHGSWAKNGETIFDNGGTSPKSEVDSARQQDGVRDLLNQYSQTKFSATEEASVTRYIQAGHNINASLYTDKKLNKEDASLVQNIEKAIDKAPRLPDIELFRVAPFEITEALQEGDVIENKGFISSTYADLRLPENGQLLLKLNFITSGRKKLVIIRGNEGKRALVPIGVFDLAKKDPNSGLMEFEREIILPRKSRLRYEGEEYLTLNGGDALPISVFTNV